MSLEGGCAVCRRGGSADKAWQVSGTVTAAGKGSAKAVVHSRGKGQVVKDGTDVNGGMDGTDVNGGVDGMYRNCGMDAIGWTAVME